MTAPTPPTPTVQEPLSAREFFNQDDAALMASWATKPEEAAPTEQPAAPVEQAPTEQPAAPQGEVELPPLKRAPMTQFSVVDDQGELEIPDVMIKFKAKGEDRELPLDHVVRLAQLGYTNEEREQQVLAARKFVSEAQERESQYQQQVQQYESYYQRIFSDPNFFEQARDAFFQQNTPEARAQRAEQEAARLRAEQGRQSETHQITNFVASVLVPATEQLLQAYPEVSQTELVGRYSQLTAPLLVQGRVPVQRLAEVQRIVQQDLKDWVERTHVERLTAKQAQERKSQQATAQVAQTKRAAARIFSQPGGVGQPPAKPVKFSTAKEWLNSTFNPGQNEDN